MHKIDMEKEYVVGIDIGSSRVTVAVGLRQEGTISIKGVETHDVGASVRDGDILNFVDLGKAIVSAKQNLEQELGCRIDSAYVGVSGKSVYFVRYEDHVDVTNPTNCVRENELRELHKRIEMVTSANGDEIVDRIPLRYRLDNMQEVRNPIGCYGHKLSATYLLVLISKQQIDMVKRTFYSADIQIEGICVNPVLLPEVLLTESEAEEGVMIVDLGGDLTDISIVREGKLSYFSSLPIGASSIDRDLYEHLQVPKKDVERFKHIHGHAIASIVPEDTAFTVLTAGHRKRQILHRNVAVITEERLKDITSFIARELKGVQYTNKLHCGVVLTGGSAYLKEIDELFARELKMSVRLGCTFNGIDDDSQEKVSFPDAAVVGLLHYGAKHKPCNVLPQFSTMERNKPQENDGPEQPKRPTDVTPPPVIDNTPKPKDEPKGGEQESQRPISDTPLTPEQNRPIEPTDNDKPQDVNNGGETIPDNGDTNNGGEKPEDATNKEQGKDKPKPVEDDSKPRGNFMTRWAERIMKGVDGLFEKNDYL